MPSVLSRMGSSHLGVGLVVGVSIGAGIAIMGKRTPKPTEQVELLKAGRDAAAARCQEARRQIEALEEKERALENQFTQSQQEHELEVSSLIQTLSGVRAEHDTLLKKLEKTTEGELRGKTLQAELDTLHTELEKRVSVAAQCEAAEEKLRMLEFERKSMCEEVDIGAKARVELEDMRLHVKELVAERDAAEARYQEARRQIEALEWKESTLEKELIHSQQVHEREVSSVMQTLSSVRAELDNSKAEHDTMRKKLEKTTEGELSGKTLQAELDTLRVEFEKRASVAAQCEAAEEKLRMFELERTSMREEVDKGAQARVELVAERDAVEARYQEAKCRIEAMEEKESKLEKELIHSQQVHEREVSSVRQTLSSVRAELDNTKAEHDTMRKKLEKAAEMELKGETLQAELDALRAEFKKCTVRCEAWEQRVRTAELERESMCKDARVRMEGLMAERDTAVTQHQEAVRQIRSLEEQQDFLQKELAINKMRRKDSLRTLSQSLFDISSLLDTVHTSWNPWQEIGNMRKRVDSILQQDAAVEDDDECEEGI